MLLKLWLKLYFHKKRHYAAPLKEKNTFFMKKNRGFVDSEFLKICHEQITTCQIWKQFLEGLVGSLTRQKFTRLRINQISQDIKVIYFQVYIQVSISFLKYGGNALDWLKDFLFAVQSAICQLWIYRNIIITKRKLIELGIVTQ